MPRRMMQQTHKGLTALTIDRYLEQLADVEDALMTALQQAEEAKAELARQRERADHLRRAIEELSAYDESPFEAGA